VGSFLAHHTGCRYTHNPNAYVFVVRINPRGVATPPDYALSWAMKKCAYCGCPQ
jgi:hypothetical protein